MTGGQGPPQNFEFLSGYPDQNCAAQRINEIRQVYELLQAKQLAVQGF